MMAQMAPHTDTERISRLLPIVKCSTCSSTVALDALGDHVCPAPPSSPMPHPSFLNKTSPLSPSALEKSLNFSSSRKSPPPSLRTCGETVRIRTLSNARKSPSPITDNFQPPTRSTSKQPPLPTSSIPFPVQRDVASPRRPDFVPNRPRQASLNTGNRSNNTASPHAISTVPPSNMSAPSAYSQPSVATTVRSPYVPLGNDRSRQYYPDENISTISGGEAGMAGVGRRGFAAAARSAMFAASYQRRADPPRFLDIDAAQRASTETPPLSAGSSHSAGQTSPFPKTPASPIPPPAGQFYSSPMSQSHAQAHKSFLDLSPTTPTKPGLNTRLPFFEKFKNKVPGAQILAANQDIIYETTAQKSAKPDTPSTAVPFDHTKSQSSDYRRLPPPPSEADSASDYAPSPPTRNISLSTPPRRVHKHDGSQSNRSSDSERGLAYADSDTDNSEYSSRSSKKGSAPPTPLPTSILRTGSIASTSHVRFPSNDTMSTMRTSRPITPAVTGRSNTPDHTAYQRKESVSSVSSTSSIGGRPRTNSSIIAQALGLSGTPPRDYEILGGPGVTGFGDREGRKSSGRSSASSRSRSRHPSEERAMKLSINTSPSRSTVSTNSGPPPPSPSTKRSNTVQAHHHSTEVRPPKLPARSNTTPLLDRGKQLDGHATDRDGDRKDKGERTRKVRVCVKCDNKIEDGRWVKCDGGTVLCDLCWKSMYLPRCRRCSKAIEKQAVSSSDGQLKGKYHRECFNCHVCHKPFPDKTFYVFDSKPLCGYHYHQANKSLCSAPKCGQPIEGPCAVSHTGERYHPEHFTCEYSGHPRCSEKLVEYWELDGRMLCERHAPTPSRAGTVEGGFYHDNRAQTAKAMKRVTRFIDLPNGIGGVGGSDLR